MYVRTIERITKSLAAGVLHRDAVQSLQCTYYTEQKRTEQNKTEQNKTEQNKTEQNRTEQNRTEQNYDRSYSAVCAVRYGKSRYCTVSSAAVSTLSPDSRETMISIVLS